MKEWDKDISSRICIQETIEWPCLCTQRLCPARRRLIWHSPSRAPPSSFGTRRANKKITCTKRKDGKWFRWLDWSHPHATDLSCNVFVEIIACDAAEKKKRIQSAHSKSHRGDLRAEKFRPSPPGGTRVTNAWLKHKKIIFYFLGPWSGPKKRPIKCPIRRETRPTELSSVLATAQNDFSALCLTFRLIHFHPGRHFLFWCQSNFTFIQISTTKKIPFI